MIVTQLNSDTSTQYWRRYHIYQAYYSISFVVETVSLGRVFSEYFGFPCQSSFHQILHYYNHPGQATIGQSVAAVPSGPSWTPRPTKRIKTTGKYSEFRQHNKKVKFLLAYGNNKTNYLKRTIWNREDPQDAEHDQKRFVEEL
jgi:hypothetical protein